jgi:hypothetical protein
VPLSETNNKNNSRSLRDDKQKGNDKSNSNDKSEKQVLRFAKDDNSVVRVVSVAMA